jgi:hypothetical protein
VNTEGLFMRWLDLLWQLENSPQNKEQIEIKERGVACAKANSEA